MFEFLLHLMTTGSFWFFFLFFMFMFWCGTLSQDTEHLPRAKPVLKRENPPGSGIYPFWIFWRVEQDASTEQVLEDQFATKVYQTEPWRFVQNGKQIEDNDIPEMDPVGSGRFRDNEPLTFDEQIKETFNMDNVNGAWKVTGSETEEIM